MEARPRRRKIAVSLAVSVAALFAMFAPTSQASSSTGGALKVLGALPDAPPDGITPQNPILLPGRPGHHELLYTWLAPPGFMDGDGLYFRIYDTSTPVPRILKTGRAAPTADVGAFVFPSPSVVTIDSKRSQIWFLKQSLTDASEVLQIDMTTLKKSRLFTPDVPGFMGYALTYSQHDDLVYLIGEWVGNAAMSQDQGRQGTGTPAWPSGIVALDPSTGNQVWTRILPQCAQPAINHQRGSYIFHSDNLPVLYFACSHAGTWPGQSGLVRLWVTPNATQTAAQQFRVDFFPISGQYTDFPGNFGTALMGFDSGAERVFLVNKAAQTSGAWVFDGNLSAWVGNIAAPSPPGFLGFSPYSGHVYLGGPFLKRNANSVLVANGRSTPVEEGKIFELAVENQQTLITDPFSSRVFIGVADMAPYGGAKGAYGVLAVDDDVPSASPLAPANFDAHTADVDEGPGTIASFAAESGGYGSRLMLVGGYGGVTSLAAQYLSVLPINARSASISPGDRGVFAGRVTSLDLREVGASASAQALAPNSLTDDEYRNKQDAAEGTVTENPAIQTVNNEEMKERAAEGGEAARAASSWPWSNATCLDAAGKPVKDHEQGLGGESEVDCDLAASSIETVSSFGALGTSLPGIDVRIGGSVTRATAVRTAQRGAISLVRAEADAIKISIPGVGGVRIQHVESAVQTVAHGRPGTASVTYDRAIEGVRITGTNGKTLFSCREDCDPATVLDQLNNTLGPRVTFSMPTPAQRATPRGAFAGLTKTDGDYYGDLTTNDDEERAVPALVMVAYNDGVQKSRLLAQFAGVRASSIYQISSLGDDCPGCILEPTLPTEVGGLQFFRDDGGTTPRTQVIVYNRRGPIQQLAHGIMVLARSPKDAALVGMIAILFVSALATWTRRRLLIECLEETQ